MTVRRIGRICWIGGAVAAVALAAACSSNNSSTSTGGTTAGSAAATTTTGGVTTSGAPQNTIPPADVKAMQENLDKVGCDVGPNDGILGPETLAALVAFQKAAGLTPDGTYGPQTKSALDAAVASGKKECVPPTTLGTTTTTGGSSASSTTAAAGAPCTSDAITAGVKAGGANLVNLDGFGCASGWAYAFATVSSTPGTVVPPGGVGVTILLQANGTTWVTVNRATYCGNNSVPQAIYANACQSN